VNNEGQDKKKEKEKGEKEERRKEERKIKKERRKKEKRKTETFPPFSFKNSFTLEGNISGPRSGESKCAHWILFF
jgi:hypothetical protein